MAYKVYLIDESIISLDADRYQYGNLVQFFKEDREVAVIRECHVVAIVSVE
jgi:hypothetical protein